MSRASYKVTGFTLFFFKDKIHDQEAHIKTVKVIRFKTDQGDASVNGPCNPVLDFREGKRKLWGQLMKSEYGLWIT